jgi:hypothetical protein
VNKITSIAISLALIVIAVNMTYSNVTAASPKSPANTEGKVLQVIGRAYVTFDGFGANTGFLVKDGDNFRVLHYDEGSVAANEMFQPKYVSVFQTRNGQVSWAPVSVEGFN